MAPSHRLSSRSNSVSMARARTLSGSLTMDWRSDMGFSALQQTRLEAASQIPSLARDGGISHRESPPGGGASVACSATWVAIVDLRRRESVFSRHELPEACVLFRPLDKRGRRESRAPIAPVGPVQQKARGEGHRFNRKHPGFPCAMVLQLISRYPR